MTEEQWQTFLYAVYKGIFSPLDTIGINAKQVREKRAELIRTGRYDQDMAFLRAAIEGLMKWLAESETP